MTIPDFKTILQSNSNNSYWYWHKNRYEDQWNRIEDPDINLFLTKLSKTYNGEKAASSTNVAGKSGSLPQE
jgi:hypothetical protein